MTTVTKTCSWVGRKTNEGRVNISGDTPLTREFCGRERRELVRTGCPGPVLGHRGNGCASRRLVTQGGAVTRRATTRRATRHATCQQLHELDDMGETRGSWGVLRGGGSSPKIRCLLVT